MPLMPERLRQRRKGVLSTKAPLSAVRKAPEAGVTIGQRKFYAVLCRPPIWVSHRSRCPRRWSGRRSVRSEVPCTRSAVRRVANSSCAPGSSRVEAHRRRCRVGRKRHERSTAGETCEGRGVPAGGHGPAGDGLLERPGVPRKSDGPIARRCTGPSGSVPGRRAEGACRVTSIARGRANLVRPHRYAASPTRS